MTTEEKLQHFLEFCMEDARSRSKKMLDEYAGALEASLAEHQEDVRRRADQQVQLEGEKIQREMNKKLSIEQVNIKRVLGHKQDQLKEKLFQELKDLIVDYMASPGYLDLLKRQISYAEDFAGKDQVEIYLDPTDAPKLGQLASHARATLKISEYPFMGGTRAVIPSRHILIDKSFQSKLDTAKHQFRFDLTGQNGTETGGNAHG